MLVHCSRHFQRACGSVYAFLNEWSDCKSKTQTRSDRQAIMKRINTFDEIICCIKSTNRNFRHWMRAGKSDLWIKTWSMVAIKSKTKAKQCVNTSVLMNCKGRVFRKKGKYSLTRLLVMQGLTNWTNGYNLYQRMNANCLAFDSQFQPDKMACRIYATRRKEMLRISK